LKALLVGPIKNSFFCGFPYQKIDLFGYLSTFLITNRLQMPQFENLPNQITHQSRKPTFSLLGTNYQAESVFLINQILLVILLVGSYYASITNDKICY